MEERSGTKVHADDRGAARELQAELKAILVSASFKSVSGGAGEHAVLAMIAGREKLGLGEKATYCVSQFLFDRERVPGVSVILAIFVVWGWVDAVEIVAGRSDFDLEGDPVNDEHG
jgi:hypothetical protein